jgi:O-methyltransferase
MVKVTLTKKVDVEYRDIRADDPDEAFFMQLFPKVAPYTMTVERGIEAPYQLFKAIQYIVRNGIPGDIVECGVWRGGSMMLAAMALRRFGDTGRKLYLYDTFEGMTRPDERDVDWDGQDYRQRWDEAHAANRTMGFGGSVDDVRANVAATGYPEENLVFVKGPVEQTIPGTVPERAALLRLDTDWYNSTWHELVHLYPRLSVGGILIVDDYGWCQGAREATDKYIADNRVRILLSRIEESVRLAVKTEP